MIPRYRCFAVRCSASEECVDERQMVAVLNRKADCPMPRVLRTLVPLARDTYVFLGRLERLASNLQAQRSGCPKVCGSYRPRCLQPGCGPWVARRSDRPPTWRRAPMMGPSMLQGLRANIVRRSKGWPRTDPCGPRN